MPLREESIYQHSEEVNEIITAVPSWILRRGITLILLILLAIILLSAFIRYPDIVKTSLKVNSLNAPKEVIAHQPGKLVKLLVKDNQPVNDKEPLAFIESTANHYDVMSLVAKLKMLSKKLTDGQVIKTNDLDTKGLNLGELQGNYQSFYQEYLQFISTQNGGFYLTQKAYLQKDLEEVRKLQQQIYKQKQIQEKEYANAEEEYENYKKLKSKNVISNSEFKQQENKYLASKYPLEQTATALINNNASYLAKQKELATLENTIKEQQAKFVQALNSMINETESWMLKYVVSAPMSGRVGYVGILQENQNVSANQELFIVNPGNTNFFGEVQIPQYNMGKVSVGQRALVKLRSYPFEEFGAINGKVSYITDVALKDSVFVAKIDFQQFEQKDPEHPIVLKQGMVADAEIITRESSLLQRFLRNMTKMFNSQGG
ncbi:HlyD family efflux transporter periplasmic adaptor subunit [Pedobacter sp. KR3-3]|uniref:HlyD family efflux transporter periplasmic adaptor subunit n=1 Tax=Pedobacter albus TaxID=3113905 RepID=A0ABU7IC94_9SPHI|nr:HlyD family efflux transporter periplasmic adaptor subunit [Pedobacter sp. KR3-3]MEE1946901.1 HlyD family efflux transporter periplasmic adaptor subunit [Pedobacter sp. KR3-3]